MKFNLPWGDQPLVKVTAKAGEWCVKQILGRSSRTYEIIIPPGINESEVEVVAEFCDVKGKLLSPFIILKKATQKPTSQVITPTPIPISNQKPKMRRQKAKRQDQEIIPDECSTEQLSTIAE